MAVVGLRVDLTNVTVLVVDDDEGVRDIFTEVLEAQGASVVAAASAEAGMQLYRREDPDVLVSDIRIPDHDGYWLIRELRKRVGDVPALAVSGYLHDDLHLRARRAGYAGVLAKPVDMDVLCAAVARLAGRTARITSAELEAAPLAAEHCAVTSMARCPYCGSIRLRALHAELRGLLVACRDCSLPFYWR